jgi:carbon monoxide dehydrogenase subunit G
MKLERRIHIDAPPARVWQVMADVERWPEWTPSVIAVRRNDDGPLRIGSSAEVDLRGTPKATWTVTQLDEGRSFWWESDATPSVAGGHIIEPDGDGANVTLAIHPRGIIGALLSPLIVRMSRANVETEAAGLKRRCEEA